MAKNFVQPTESRGVEPRVRSSSFRAAAWRRRVFLFFVGTVGLAGWSRAVGAPIVAQLPTPAPEVALTPTPPKPAAPTLDELVFTDGDRVRGHFIKRDGDIVVFKSERFGLLRVPANSVQLTLAKTPTSPVAAAGAKAEKAEVWAWPFSPVAMAKALKGFFGSWHGKFAVSTELLSDTAEHDSATAQLHLERKMARDEEQLNARYDFASANHVTSTDMIKGDALWRHDFPNQLFSTYRPSLEWNRNFYRDNLPADYVLLQQEVGAGINLWNTEKRKLRFGLSENIFSVWVTPPALRAQNTHTAESSFVELESKLPWRITVTDRAIYYYSILHNTEGWENHFEIDKKLTETVTMGVQHEVRTNDPDIRAADYRRLKLFFGFDF